MRPPRLARRLLLHDRFHDGRVLHLDQAIGHHVVQRRQHRIDFLCGLDEFDSNRQVLRQHLDLRRVHNLMRPEARHRAAGRGTRHTFAHEESQYRLI